LKHLSSIKNWIKWDNISNGEWNYY